MTMFKCYSKMTIVIDIIVIRYYRHIVSLIHSSKDGFHLVCGMLDY